MRRIFYVALRYAAQNGNLRHFEVIARGDWPNTNAALGRRNGLGNQVR